MESEVFLPTPRSKAVKTFLARVKVFDNESMVINPQATRESNRRILQRKGNSSFYKSEGARDSSFTVHINIPADTADPVAEMEQQFNELVAAERKTAPQVGSTGRMLFDQPSLRLYLDDEHHEVVLQCTLPCTSNIERELLQLQGDMAKAIARFRTDIMRSAKNKISNPLNK